MFFCYHSWRRSGIPLLSKSSRRQLRRQSPRRNCCGRCATGYFFMVRELGGMTTSWRPNNRASSEKTPGPSKEIATAMTIISKDAVFPESNSPSGMGNQDNAFARKTNVNKRLTMGVRNPMSRHAPHTARAKLIIRSDKRAPSFERADNPCAKAMAPTTTRIKSSAIPGLPPGNVEKNLCSVILPDRYLATPG